MKSHALARLSGAAVFAAGAGLLAAGVQLHAALGWSVRVVFLLGGVLAGYGLAYIAVPGSAARIGTTESAGGSAAGWWVARVCLWVGVAVGVGLWLTN